MTTFIRSAALGLPALVLFSAGASAAGNNHYGIVCLRNDTQGPTSPISAASAAAASRPASSRRGDVWKISHRCDSSNENRSPKVRVRYDAERGGQAASSRKPPNSTAAPPSATPARKPMCTRSSTRRQNRSFHHAGESAVGAQFALVIASAAAGIRASEFRVRGTACELLLSLRPRNDRRLPDFPWSARHEPRPAPTHG